MDFVGSVIGATAGIGIAVALVPAGLGALGFTAAGITAGSVAAKMMSLTALANGGQVASGSLVAIAQSVGAAGVSKAVTAALSATGAVIGGSFYNTTDPQ
ncbi:interferon alpha-inducible protein 27-like protein 2A isoform X2 [Athene noctua]